MTTYQQFEQRLKGQYVRLEHVSSGQPVATISVRAPGSNVTHLYQVPYAWVAAFFHLENYVRQREWVHQK